MSDDLTPGATPPDPLPTLPPAPPTLPPQRPMMPGYGAPPPYGAQAPGYGAPPPYGVPLSMAPKPASKRWRIWVPILVVVVGAAVAGAVVLSGSNDPKSVPRLTETRPTYGTVQMTVTLSELALPTLSYVVESDADGSAVAVSGSDLANPLDPTSSATPFEFIVSSGEYWSYDFESSVWVKAAAPDTGLYTELNGLVTTVMLSEYLPDVLRKYTRLLDEKDETVSGHAVTVYDLRLDLPSFERDKPEEYQAWAARLGISEALANTAIELAVDADGVVWRMRSSDVTDSGLRTSTYEQELKVLPAGYQQDYPTSYYDEASGQMVG